MDIIEKGKWIDTPCKFKQYIELLKRLIFKINFCDKYIHVETIYDRMWHSAIDVTCRLLSIFSDVSLSIFSDGTSTPI